MTQPSPVSNGSTVHPFIALIPFWGAGFTEINLRQAQNALLNCDGNIVFVKRREDNYNYG